MKTIKVVAAVIKKQNKVFVTQRGYGEFKDGWEFPGGKLEEDESEIDCIIREIREEINIEIKVLEKLSNSIYDYGTFKINLIPFISTYVSGEIILTEHKDYKIIEELKSWEVLCKLNNDSIIYASLPRHTEANMLSKNINDELYIKNFYLLG